MNYPSLQVNNFFDNVDYIRDYAESLTYEKPDGNYPGLRAKPEDQFGYDLFGDINSRILRLLYPDYQMFQSIGWNATSSFQKIKYEDVEAHILNKENTGKGWIHNDHESKFTSIIYLSKYDGCGTALYSPKNNYMSNFNSVKYGKADSSIKNDYYYKNPDLKLDEYYKALNEHLNSFKLDCLFNSSYNKMIGFDGSNPHGAFYNLKPREERLMFISFFRDIFAPHYPVPEMRRT
jgi:hypothetical protein|tara:strand:+ start:27 stop:728 length:702 start_codon:yes stop_codon:yes gene_type:complete